MRELSRRGLLQGITVLAGIVATPVSAQTIFSGPKSLPPASIALLEAVADSMIPATDTPGAVGAGVPAMFNKMLANWASPPQRTLLLGALDQVETETAAKFGARFTALTVDKRYEALRDFDQAQAANPAYAMLKELLVSLYYLSEIGATVELRYEHVPGVWEPSIPVTAETRAYGGPGI